MSEYRELMAMREGERRSLIEPEFIEEEEELVKDVFLWNEEGKVEAVFFTNQDAKRYILNQLRSRQ